MLLSSLCPSHPTSAIVAQCLHHRLLILHPHCLLIVVPCCLQWRCLCCSHRCPQPLRCQPIRRLLWSCWGGWGVALLSSSACHWCLIQSLVIAILILSSCIGFVPSPSAAPPPCDPNHRPFLGWLLLAVGAHWSAVIIVVVFLSSRIVVVACCRHFHLLICLLSLFGNCCFERQTQMFLPPMALLLLSLRPLATKYNRVEEDNGVKSLLLSAPPPPPRQQIGGQRQVAEVPWLSLLQ